MLMWEKNVLGGKAEKKGARNHLSFWGQKRSQLVYRISQIHKKVSVKCSWKEQMKAWPKG